MEAKQVLNLWQAKAFWGFVIAIFKNHYLIGENIAWENFYQVNFLSGKTLVIWCLYSLKHLLKEKVCWGKFSITLYPKMRSFTTQIKIKERCLQLNNYTFSV